MLDGLSCAINCIPHIASTAHGLVLFLLRIHIHVLISCNLRTTACGLLPASLRLSSVSPGICNTYHYIVRCLPRSNLLLPSLSPIFPLLSPLGADWEASDVEGNPPWIVVRAHMRQCSSLGVVEGKHKAVSFFLSWCISFLMSSFLISFFLGLFLHSDVHKKQILSHEPT